MNAPIDADDLAARRAAELDHHGHRALWTSVLVLGVLDARDAAARLGTPGERRGPGQRHFEGDRATLGWLGGADFKAVCHLADLNPDWVLRKLKEAGIHQPEQETTTCKD